MAGTHAEKPQAGITPDTGLHYLRYGSGPPVIFLHGLGACKELWWATFHILASTFDCLAYELPGHGASPIPATYDLEPLATLDARDFALWRGRRPPPYTDRTHRTLRRLTRPLALLGQQVSPDDVGSMLRPLARRMHAWLPVTAAAMRGYIAAIWADPLGPRLAAIRQPTLIIQGTRDPLVLARQARRAASHIQGAYLRLIPGAFHTPMDENPTTFVAHLRDFLTETKGAGLS